MVEICTECGKELKTIRGMTMHLKRVHNIDAETRVKELKKEREEKIAEDEKMVYAVCMRSGGYQDTNNPDGLQLPEKQIVALTPKQWESAKAIAGVKEVKVGPNITV